MSNKHDLPPLPDPDERTRKGCAFSAFAMHDYAIAAIQRLEAENANLRSVMVAAAEEIAAHWEAHCDDEGYGPANLMHRLEKGIPTKYCYTAGDFARLKAENEALKKDAAAFEWLLNVPASAVHDISLRQWLWKRPWGPDKMRAMIARAMTKEAA